MRCSVMFIRVKTSSKEECSRSLALRSAQVSAQDMGTGADRGRLESTLVWGLYQQVFWTVPEAALQGIYTAICHATSKTVKTPFIIWNSWKNKQTERPVPKYIYIYIYIYEEFKYL